MLPVYKMNCLPVSAYISILLYDRKNTVDVIYTTNTRHQKCVKKKFIFIGIMIYD